MIITIISHSFAAFIGALVIYLIKKVTVTNLKQACEYLLKEIDKKNKELALQRTLEMAREIVRPIEEPRRSPREKRHSSQEERGRSPKRRLRKGVSVRQAAKQVGCSKTHLFDVLKCRRSSHKLIAALEAADLLEP